ncbi:rod-binding protein [bacterium]|nr:rod-binding protein [bacterium]
MENSISSVSSNVLNHQGLVNNDAQVFNKIKESCGQKAQLKKIGQEFESMFITKMLTLMDKTVDREGGVLGEDTKYVDTFKNHVFQEMGRQLSSNPHTSIGMASQIYKQMERYIQE